MRVMKHAVPPCHQLRLQKIYIYEHAVVFVLSVLCQ
jgi:hypothetical protein